MYHPRAPQIRGLWKNTMLIYIPLIAGNRIKQLLVIDEPGARRPESSVSCW